MTCVRHKCWFKKTALPFLLAAVSQTLAISVKTDYFQRICGSSLMLSDLPAGSLRLDLSRGSNMSLMRDCTVTVLASPHMRICLSFLQFNIKHLRSGDYFQIFYSPSDQFEEHEQIESRCSPVKSFHVVSAYNNVTLRFVSDQAAGHNGPSLHFTAFHEGECCGSEFQCANNRCIDKHLLKDGVDNCGDGSDECTLTALVYVKVMIVLTSVLVLVTVLALASAIRYHCKRRRSSEANEKQDGCRLICSSGDPSCLLAILEGASVMSTILVKFIPSRPAFASLTAIPSRHLAVAAARP